MANSLAVVIVNFNTGRYLIDCIRSIKKTTNVFLTPEIELIVIDNASTDESITGIKSSTRLDSARQAGTTSIQIIRNKKNLGFAKAANQGIKKSTYDYILLLNPDTIVKKDAIANLLKFAESKNYAGVVGARLLNPDGTIQPSVFRLPTVWGAIREFWFGERDAYLKYKPIGEEPITVEAVVGAAFLITPQAREKVGMIDERFWMYFEDLDYCRRVKKAGLKIYYLPSAQIIHYHGISGRNEKDEKDQWRRLIPSSKIYHGLIQHYLINFVLWSGQKMKKLL